MGRKRTSAIWSVESEIFAEIVKKSSTITEILNHFGLYNKGANFKTLYKRIEEECLDISHLNSKGVRVGKLNDFNKNRKLSNEEVFIENSTYSTTHLKQRIIDDNLIEYECECCGNKGEWCGKPLKLQLEHKNGIHTDNRLENLCFLCPNCHSQTETYAGKSTRKRLCEDCGKHIPHKSKKTGLCRKCFDKKKLSNSNRPSKDELELLIKEKTFVQIGKDFGVSDSAVKK